MALDKGSQHDRSLDETGIQDGQDGLRNRDGTTHQSQLGPKPKRKHFFSPLDPMYADAVNRDGENVEYTPEEEVRMLSHAR